MKYSVKIQPLIRRHIYSSDIFFYPPFLLLSFNHFSIHCFSQPFTQIFSPLHNGCMSGVVRVEQKNSSLWENGIYDDGPYEVGDESRLDPELVPVPASSYLGESMIHISFIIHAIQKPNLPITLGLCVTLCS